MAYRVIGPRVPIIRMQPARNEQSQSEIRKPVKVNTLRIDYLLSIDSQCELARANLFKDQLVDFAVVSDSEDA